MKSQLRQRATVNGVDLEYDLTGQGEPVLFISPVLADAFVPLLSERRLVNRHRLITYHKRGWMGSTHADGPVSVVDHANDAAALVDHLGIARAHIVGHSSGAAVALQLALMRPDLVHTISLLELSLLSVPGAAGLLQKAAPAFDAYARGDYSHAVSVFLSAVSGLEWDACRKLLDERVPGAITAAIDDATTLFGVELPGLSSWSFGPEQAARMSSPVLSVLGSETEPLWVEIAELLRSWFPQVEEAMVEGAGHLLQIQRPDAVARALAAFFERPTH